MVENEKILIGHTLDVTQLLDILELDIHELLDILDEGGYLEDAREELLRACI